MKNSAHTPISPTLPVQTHVEALPNTEHQLSFGERATQLHQMIEAGYVPTEEEFGEIQDIVGATKQKMVYDYDEGYVGKGDFVGPNNEPISSEVALGLWGAAQPTRWVQRPNDERLLSQVAGLRRQSIMTVYDKLAPLMPRVFEATKTLVPDTEQLTPEALDRLVILSRISREQLRERGVDVEKILAQRGRATASVPAVAPLFDRDESIRPQELGEIDDAKIIPHVGRISARAAVFNRETGKPLEYAKTIPAGETPLRWFILNDVPSSQVAETLRARRAGGESTYRYSKQLHKTKVSKELSGIQAQQASNLADQLAAFEGLEAFVNTGGGIPDRDHVASVLFPGKEEHLEAEDNSVIDTALAKLTYLSSKYDAVQANKAPKVDRLVGIYHARVEAERWFGDTKEAFMAFIEKATPIVRRVTPKVGRVLAGALIATSFLSAAKAVDTRPPQPKVAVSSASRGRPSV